jgi:hypothetical protein
MALDGECLDAHRVDRRFLGVEAGRTHPKRSGRQFD